MMRKLLMVGLALSALGLMQATAVSASQRDAQAAVTLSQPVTEAGRQEFPSIAVLSTVAVEQEDQLAAANSLPQPSTVVTLIVLIGCVGICLGSLLTHFRKAVPVANR